MKITYIVSNYCPVVGGLELYAQGIAERMAKRGHGVNVITSLPKGCAKKAEINGVTVHRLRGIKFVFGKATYFPKITETITEIMPDVVHCLGHSHLRCVQAAIAAKGLGIPVYVLTYGPVATHTVRGPLGHALSEIYDFAVTPWLFRNAAAILYRTPNLKQWCMEKGAGKAFLSTTGIDEPFFNGAKLPGKDANTVGFVGTVCRRKGIHYLVEAAPAVLAKKPGAEFVVVGSGNTETNRAFENELRQRINELGVEKAFRFVKTITPHTAQNRRALLRMFDSFDVVVLPSAFEAPGQAVLQAMARGKVAVVADIPQLKGIIGSENALFVKFGDSAGLAERVSTALSDHALRKKMANANIRAAKKFSLNRLALELENVYLQDAGRGKN